MRHLTAILLLVPFLSMAETSDFEFDIKLDPPTETIDGKPTRLSGHEFACGTAPGEYTASVSLPADITEATVRIDGLPDGTEVFCAARSKDALEQISDFSEEVTAVVGVTETPPERPRPPTIIEFSGRCVESADGFECSVSVSQ